MEVTSAPPHAIASLAYGLSMYCITSLSRAISERHWVTASSTFGSLKLSQNPFTS